MLDCRIIGMAARQRDRSDITSFLILWWLWLHTQFCSSPPGATVNSHQPLFPPAWQIPPPLASVFPPSPALPLCFPSFLSLPPSLLPFPLKQSNCLQHSSESPTPSDADQAPASQSLFSTTPVNTSHGSRSHWNLLLTLVCVDAAVLACVCVYLRMLCIFYT